jgi:hypothetical protein
MFPQSPELTAKLGTMRQAEIRAELARYHMMREARAVQPSHQPRWLTTLWQLVRVRLWTLGQHRKARPTTVR